MKRRAVKSNGAAATVKVKSPPLKIEWWPLERIKEYPANARTLSELYRKDEIFDGRLEMARSLQRQHPDVCKVTWKWGRWQHQVDYRPFAKNKLIRRANAEIPDGPNEYGMHLHKIA